MWPIGRLDLLDAGDLAERDRSCPSTGSGPRAAGWRRPSSTRGCCTASFVSADGLIVTNHHCAFDVISRNSTPEENLVDDGFVAASRADERNGYATTIKVLLGFTDVTTRVSGGLPDDPLERIRAIEKREAELVAECEATAGHRCRVARFNDGVAYGALPEGSATGVRRFVLFDTLEIKDVRLVANPPLAVGEYGGEVDNWHWPRHDGDWSFLRAYVGPDGAPAEFAEVNVPYRPAYWLKVSTTGLAPSDLVLVMGYPWSTVRYQTAAEVSEAQEWLYPLRLELFSTWIAQLEEASKASEDGAAAQRADTKGINNARSHAVGMIGALRRSGARARDGPRRSASAPGPRPIRDARDTSRRSTASPAVAEEKRSCATTTTSCATLSAAASPASPARSPNGPPSARPDLEREPGY